MKKKREISQYKNNDNLDLEKVIDEYNAYVYTIIKNMARDNLSKEDIEEIVSDTFFILWKNKEKLDDEKLLSSYIAGIVRNLVKEKLRVINILLLKIYYFAFSKISIYSNVIFLVISLPNLNAASNISLCSSSVQIS